MKPPDLGSLRSVRVADVYKAGRRAATLTRGSEANEFAYGPDYLATDAPAVATTLPRRTEPVRTTGGAVPPFFAGLLPEGRRLAGLRRAVKTSADDELSLLLAVGRDTVGDVQVVPHGREPRPAEPLLQVKKDWSEIHFSALLEDAGVVDPVGLPGVQEKASARMISVPLGRAGERFLLKVDPPEYPHVVENEAFFLALAREVRLEAAAGRVVRDADGRAGLLVRRFDRIAREDGTASAIACEDACQVLGRWPADKYNVSTEEVAKGLSDHCAARLPALLALFRQVCFAWLTGNGDLHAKNLSILSAPEGDWRIAPAYDVPATRPYGDLTLALPVQGKTRGLSRRHLLAFASEVGLPERPAIRALDDLLARLKGLDERLRSGALPYAQKVIADWTAEIRNRCRLAA